MADATPGEGNGLDPEKEQAEQSAKRILEEGAASDARGTMPESLRFLAEKAQLQEIELRKEYATQEIELRETYAKGLLAILAAIARATTQPTKVQPRKRLITKTLPWLVTFRATATMVGKK